MKKILLSLCLFIPLTVYAKPSDLFRPTGIDILKNCSRFLEKKELKTLHSPKRLEKTFMLSMCKTAITNTYQTIRGPMIAMRDADMVCYQDYYHLAEKSDISVLDLTVNYIKKHQSIGDANLSTIMSLMMNEYYPIPSECKK